MWAEIRQTLDEHWRRITAMVKIGRVAAVDDTHYSQVVQVQLGANQTVEIRKIGHYGFAYNPPVNSDAVVLALSGDPRNSFVVGTEFQASRPRELQPGEAALWDDQGQMILLGRTGIRVVQAGLPVTFDGDVIITGNVTAAEVFDAGGALSVLREAYDTHQHPVPGVTSGTDATTTLPPETPV